MPKPNSRANWVVRVGHAVIEPLPEHVGARVMEDMQDLLASVVFPPRTLR
jgi:hypothetical protein